MWLLLGKKPVAELTFSLPFCGKMTVNVNVIGVMDDSCFLVCHTEPVCDIWKMKWDLLQTFFHILHLLCTEDLFHWSGRMKGSNPGHWLGESKSDNRVHLKSTNTVLGCCDVCTVILSNNWWLLLYIRGNSLRFYYYLK